MKYAGRITNQPISESYAECPTCELVFRDDCREFGTIRCPRCRDALRRGLSREQAAGLLDVAEKEKLY